MGPVILASDGEALTGLWFEGQKHAAFPDPVRVEGNLPVFRQACRWLDIYFSGRDPGFTPPLRLSGSPFRRAVWEMLLTVPFGRTVTYGEMASHLAGWNGAARVSPRAVGGAVARNPVSLIVPCHRVVAADGLGGYAAGPARKLALLSLEKAVFPPPRFCRRREMPVTRGTAPALDAG